MIKVGDKIRLIGEKQRYTVQACDDRFVIMTKPYNLKSTYSYTIADRQRSERGACNLIFGTPFDLDTTEGANAAMVALHGIVHDPATDITMSVSYRNCVKLHQSEIHEMWGKPLDLVAEYQEPGE